MSLRFSKAQLLACVFLGGFLACQSAPADTPMPAKPAVTAFVHVNVLPMDTERVLRDQTVLVQDGRIAAIGPQIPVPTDASVIDGHGSAWLSPGLADMHVHSDTAQDMKVYLANGVTSVLNMGNASYSFIAVLRPQLNRGELPGPHVYAGFMIDGSPRYEHLFVTTPDEARAVVDIAKTNGYDFIKVYNDLSPECFAALIEEGKRQHLGVIGHGVTSVGLEQQLAQGQVMVAHTEEFLYTVFSDTRDGGDPTPPKPADIPRVIAFILHDGAYVTADLNTYATIDRQWGKYTVLEGFMHSPEFRYLSPQRRLSWRNSSYAHRHGSDKIDVNLAFLTRFTKAMADAGVPLLAGTDAPAIPGLVPGYSLHDDLDTLESAGLSRYQALSSATRIPGEFIQRYVTGAEPFGTVAVGDRADLILSATDPLEGLATLRQPLGVMAQGQWYSNADLKALLDNVAEEYDTALVH